MSEKVKEITEKLYQELVDVSSESTSHSDHFRIPPFCDDNYKNWYFLFSDTANFLIQKLEKVKESLEELS